MKARIKTQPQHSNKTTQAVNTFQAEHLISVVVYQEHEGVEGEVNVVGRVEY